MENTKPKNKYEAQRKYNSEVFNGLYPIIFQILRQLDLTEIRTEYIVNGISFQIRKYGDTVEMGLTSESQTEYSLSFSYSANKGIELLEYYVSKAFKQAIFDAADSYDDASGLLATPRKVLPNISVLLVATTVRFVSSLIPFIVLLKIC